MSLLFFESILMELGRKLRYDAVVNYAGNSFCEKSWDMICDANPMIEEKDRKMNSIAAFFNSMSVQRVTRAEKPEAFGPVTE